MDTLRSTFEIQAIPATQLETLRATGADAFGNPVRPRPAYGWEPLRCCLRRPEPGEPVAVVCYTPWTAGSPWMEAGPVFVHTDECEGYRTPSQYPPELADRHCMFNTFLADGSRDYEHIRFVTPEEDHAAALREVLAQPEVDHVHVRSATAGCFTFAAYRA